MQVMDFVESVKGENAIREFIQQEMKSRGINNNTLATKSGISRMTIGKYLSGHQGITVFTLLTLLDALELDIVLQRRSNSWK